MAIRKSLFIAIIMKQGQSPTYAKIDICQQNLSERGVTDNCHLVDRLYYVSRVYITQDVGYFSHIRSSTRTSA